MEELAELKQQLTRQRPAGWDDLPDIPLYMDQVVGYLARQMVSMGEGDALTSAMINNYIKDGLVERANGKKYGQEHLAYLTAICALKQVMSVREMKVLTTVGRELRHILPGGLTCSFQNDIVILRSRADSTRAVFPFPSTVR